MNGDGEKSNSENFLAQELDNTVMWKQGDTSEPRIESGAMTIASPSPPTPALAVEQ